MGGKAFVNDKPGSIVLLRKLTTGVCLWFAAISWSAAADILKFVDDPLSAKPPALTIGAMLPGDSEPISCPSTVDLAQPLALGDVVDLALCNNPQLKASWAAIKIQSNAVGEARAAYLPTLHGSVSKLHNDTRYPDFPASNTSSLGHSLYLGLNWRLFDFGGRAANNEVANHLLNAALASHDAALQKSLSEVIKAYFDAMTAQASLSARTAAAEIAQETLLATRRREAKGVVALSDTLQADTALAKARLELHRAEGDFRKALSVLVYCAGLPTGTVLKLPGEPAESSREAINELSVWIANAQERHPEIVAARRQLAAAKAKVDVVRSEGLPAFDFTSNFYQNGYPNQGLQSTKTNVGTVGVTLTIPLFEGFGRQYKIHGAKAQAEQKEAQMEDVEHQVLTELVRAHADAQASLDNLQSSEALFSAAQTAVRSSERRYSKGAADILELLATQSALADAQQQRIRCLAEWHSARLRLLASAGVLGKMAVNSKQNDFRFLPPPPAGLPH